MIDQPFEHDDALSNAIQSEPELQEASDLLAELPEPQPVSPELKNTIMAAIAETTQLPPETPVTDLASRRRFRPARIMMAAAACLVIASVGGGITALWQRSGNNENTISAQEAGHQEMHAIMAAPDLRSAKIKAEGASLSIVVADSMGKGGAMVDGQPEVKPGMGAQVWAVEPSGTMHSAGVIGPEPHDGVWMPLPGNTERVMVTMEPVAGSGHPTGPVLAETSF